MLDLLLDDFMLLLRRDGFGANPLYNLVFDLFELAVLENVQLLNVSESQLQLFEVPRLLFLPVVELEKLVGELRALQRLMLVFREVVGVADHGLVGRVHLLLSAFFDLEFYLVRTFGAVDISLGLYVVLEGVVLEHFVEHFGRLYESDFVVSFINHGC